MEEFLGIEPMGLMGKKNEDFFPPEIAAMFGEMDNRVRASPVPLTLDEPTPNRTGGITHFYSVKFKVQGPGIPEGTVASISVDITRIKVAATEALISAQKDTIRELATPLMPIAEGVLVMPLIGKIDEERADRIMETLLDGIGRYQASISIIDITGVKAVDAQVAEALMQAARAVQLLGAKVVLTGIRPQIARTLIELGVDWQGLVTEATLQGGIAYALRTKLPAGTSSTKRPFPQ
jgi:anti-anti-sigma regulatory factor